MYLQEQDRDRSDKKTSNNCQQTGGATGMATMSMARLRYGTLWPLMHFYHSTFSETQF